jgi:hypothetical protein
MGRFLEGGVAFVSAGLRGRGMGLRAIGFG